MVWLICVLTVILPLAQQPEASFHKVHVISSKLTIHGKTNVSSFDCQLTQTFNPETLNVTSQESDFNIDFDGLVLKYGVGEFDCGHEMMNKDFRAILDQENHPYLFLKINEIYINETTSLMEKLNVRSFVTISLAGIERIKTIEGGTVINHDDQVLTFIGSKQLQMTDFGIDPPTKFLGLVSVEDELVVSFEIKMKTIAIE